MAEIDVKGKMYFSLDGSTIDSLICPVFSTIMGESADTSLTTVTYSDANTPIVTTIAPLKGTAAGGVEVTITGSGFSTELTENAVEFDGVECTISAATETEITCLTGARPSFVPPMSVVRVNGSKAVVPSDQTFIYIDNWSS
jgi:hypothetical protein